MIASLMPEMAPPLGAGVWTDTGTEVPDGRALRHAFTGETIEPEQTGGVYTIAAARLFDRFPIALLTT